MSEKVLSFEELVDATVQIEDCDVLKVETKRGIVTLASASSEGILAWFEENDSDDIERRRYKGLRLVVRCIVNPDGTRVATTPEQVQRAVALLKARDSRENAKLVDAAFKVNGLTIVKMPKNESNEATASGASSTDSQPSSAT